MKKLLSIMLAICLCLTFTMSAFASELPTSDSVCEEIDNTVAYLTNGVSSYGVNNATDYYYLSKISAEADDYFEGFLDDVKQNLNNNGGKIVSSYGENLTTYAAVISILDLFGEDVFDFEGVDLVALMEATPLSTVTNPYYYDIVINTATMYCNDDFTISICDDFIDNYYTDGSGMDYYGFSCDNTAMFISAIAGSGFDMYSDVIEDAVAVLETYKVDGGYCYNPTYGTEASPDSTALALKALSIYAIYKDSIDENVEAITNVYKELLAFKGTTPGSYMAYGAEDAYATNDALKGLDEYYTVMLIYEMNMPDDDDNGETGNNTNNNNNNGNNTQNNNNGNNNTNNNNVEIPNTGAKAPVAIALVAISATVAVVSLKKKED